MISLSADSATELFARAVRTVPAYGERGASGGKATQELIGVHLCLTRPRHRFICVPGVRVLNPAFAAAETVWILSGSDADWIHTYNGRLARFIDQGVLKGAYGPRLRRWRGEVDQLDRVRTLLTEDPSTRRAVIQLYDPALDHQRHKDVPCTLGYRFYLRGGRLEMHTTMRSQDLWLGFCCDVFAATALHELMAGWIGAQLGCYHHHVDSLHLYAEHLPPARTLPVNVDPGPVMQPLDTPWESFDQLLRQILDARFCAHPGWGEFGEVMHSYRVWKDGGHDDARHIASTTRGPLASALTTWYDHLTRTTAGRSS